MHSQNPTSNLNKTSSLRSAALTAGTSIVAMAILAGFAYGFVLPKTLVPGNSNATVTALQNNATLFLCALLAFVLVLVCDLICSRALFLFLKKVDQKLSGVMAILRIIYTIFLGIALVSLLKIWMLIPEKSLEQTVFLLFDHFELVWSAGLLIFGLHLALLAYLLAKSGFVPKIWAILIFIAALCYLGTNSAKLFLPSYANYKTSVEGILSLPMIAGELGFGIWLLVKGGKNK